MTAYSILNSQHTGRKMYLENSIAGYAKHNCDRRQLNSYTRSPHVHKSIKLPLKQFNFMIIRQSPPVAIKCNIKMFYIKLSYLHSYVIKNTAVTNSKLI